MGTELAAVPLVLLPSPLLGPAVWAPTAAALRRRDREVLVPPSYPALSTPGDVLAHLLAEIPVGRPVVLVPHSNAGLYVAALAAAREVAGVVFVDSGVPSDSPGTPTAPPAFQAHLRTLVRDDGLLPVWTQWWPEEDVAGLFPDAATRAAVEADQGRLPLDYFDAEVPSPAGWRDVPTAYLAFGDTYATERDDAERRGRPVETLAGEHLHTTVDPDGVAAVVARLLLRLAEQTPPA